MNVMFPVLIIAIGIAVLVLGKKLAVMGAAVGALLGVALLRLLNIPLTDVLLTLLIPGLLAVIGFFVAGFAKGIVNIVLLVLGALAGAAICLVCGGSYIVGRSVSSMGKGINSILSLSSVHRCLSRILSGR